MKWSWPALVDHVGGPVPARVASSTTSGCSPALASSAAGSRVVVDAHGLEGPAFGVALHDPRPSAVQVDADAASLSFHRALLPSFPGWLRNPECARRTRFTATGGNPAVHLVGSLLRFGHEHRPRSSGAGTARSQLTGTSRGSGAALLHGIKGTTERARRGMSPAPRPLVSVPLSLAQIRSTLQ